MTNYLVLYRSTMTAAEQMAQSTPEQAQAGMEAWMTWAEQAGDAVVDLGAPLAVVDAGGDSGDPIGGYSILQAESAEALGHGSQEPSAPSHGRHHRNARVPVDARDVAPRMTNSTGTGRRADPRSSSGTHRVHKRLIGDQ